MSPNLLRTASLMLISLFASANALGGLLGPSNLQECLLNGLPGASNDTVAGEIVSKCAREFGVGGRIEKKDGLFAAFHSGSECTLAKARSTPSRFAAQVIQANCYLLYEPSSEFDPSTAVPVELGK